jgi:hypothetical protein
VEISASPKRDAIVLPSGSVMPFCAAMIVALLVTAGLTAATILLLDRPSLWRPMSAALVIGTLASGASIAPMFWGLSRSMHELTTAAMISMGLRLLITAGGLLLAIRGGHFPALPVGIMLMPFYFAALITECAFLVRLMRSVREARKES